ncbi:hypothetical protein Bca4012_062493 [Brassica carinata]
MPSITRSKKNKELLSTDPAALERLICKQIRSTSIDTPACASTDIHQQPSTEFQTPSTDTSSPASTDLINLTLTDTLSSTDTFQYLSTNVFPPTSTDTAIRISIDTEPQNLVATLILKRDGEGNLLDQEGHLRNAAGQRINNQGAAIPDLEAEAAAAAAKEANRNRSLADYNRPDQYYANRSAIRPPDIQRADFEVKPQYYTLVGHTPYSGASNEHPMDHLERYEDLISAIKANGVPADYLLCKLFKYSLTGEALQWLKQLPPGSLTSWDDIKNAFLINFSDEARAEELRSKIATFMQKPTEPFRHCWVRFNSYQRDCPHHGFNEVQLLNTFFRGLDLTYQTALDTASEGNFNTMNPEEAVRLIENLATSNSTKNTDYERRKLANALGKEQLDDVRAKLDSVNKFRRKQVSFAENEEAIETDEERYEEEVNYIGGFQRFGNQNANRNFYGNSQRSNYN